jgi:UDP-N-acetyl-D-galactosamine dehydrogenase
MNFPKHEDLRIAVLGLGYVGLPLAVEFGRFLPTIGYDVNLQRIAELRTGYDRTGELSAEEISRAGRFSATGEISDLGSANVFVVTVPTPVDKALRPDLRPLISACEAVSRVIGMGAVVIFESTVYPGATEEVCVPTIEKSSGLQHNRDFFTGYSPERINPGDAERRLSSIVKITSGSTLEVARFVDGLYSVIITAGTHMASSIKVAEAAKVIENTQRDLNIALINELAVIFHEIGIDTHEVLNAAGTKWNFLPFKPGLVGGHCIGVDPYYLTHKAQECGLHPEIVLAGRRVNDGMGVYIANRVIKLMAQKGIPSIGGRVLVLGFAFKESCKDFRNTKVIDLVRELEEHGIAVDLYDPWIDADEALKEHEIQLLTMFPTSAVYDGVVVAVGHPEFRAMGVTRIKAVGKQNHVLFDIKGIFDKIQVDGRL